MSKTVSFYLGPAIGLSSRQLTITRMPRAGDDTMPSAEYDQSLGGTVETVSVSLPDNQIWQAKLVDSLSGGGSKDPDLLSFHTGDLQIPGPSSAKFSVIAIDDESSSSISTSSSLSSSSSSLSSSLSSQSSSLKFSSSSSSLGTSSSMSSFSSMSSSSSSSISTSSSSSSSQS